jgi:predicted AAA+ superfamily ATPase
VRNLEPFARFLKMAALFNGQVVNVAGVSRDAGVARPSVERYFSILTDTLIGSWVPGWQPRLKVREKLNPNTISLIAAWSGPFLEEPGTL